MPGAANWYLPSWLCWLPEIRTEGEAMDGRRARQAPLGGVAPAPSGDWREPQALRDGMLGGVKYHLAQYNIARLLEPLDSPRLADFMSALDPLNRLADESPGFVWRHQTEDGNSTSIRVRGDPMIIINFSVWESIESLFEYAYHSPHVEIFRRRWDFFEHQTLPYLVLWWVPAGHEPSVAEAEERLDYLREHGPSPYAFTFKSRHLPPE